MSTHQTQPLGECPLCKAPNPYTMAACQSCGARLPWAGALDEERRARVAAEQQTAQQPSAAPVTTSTAPPAIPGALPPAADPDKNLKTLGLIGGALLIVLLLVSLFGGFNSSSSGGSSGGTSTPSLSFGTPPIVTMEEYSRIQPGMSYAEVVAIIGAEGTENTRNEMAGFVTVGYMWQNSGGSNVMAIFQNDKLQTKAQAGL